jgi:hypothetical protein
VEKIMTYKGITTIWMIDMDGGIMMSKCDTNVRER